MPLVAASALSEEEAQFLEFMHKYNKRYNSKDEYEHRLAVFSENYRRIKPHLGEPASPSTYRASINSLSDLTMHEVAGGPRTVPPLDAVVEHDIEAKNLTEVGASLPHIDWRGYLGEVRNMRPCNAHQAFSVVASLEFYSSESHLSEQQFVDCDYKNKFCEGGSVRGALMWAEEFGVTNNKRYPYLAYNRGSCFWDPAMNVFFFKKAEIKYSLPEY